MLSGSPGPARLNVSLSDMRRECPFVDMRLELEGAVVLDICRILILITAVYTSAYFPRRERMGSGARLNVFLVSEYFKWSHWIPE